MKKVFKTSSGILALLLLLVGCSHIQKTYMAISGNPYSESELRDIGAETYTLYCVRCHGAEGMGNGSESLSLSAQLPNFTDGSYEKSLGLVAANIKYGKRQEMPAFKNILTDREVWAVAQYVMSLKK
jgi:mono/diheme cytochrome c family protein